VAIDPKPLLAEPEYDVVTLLWNPIGFAVTPEATERRIRTLAAAGLDEQRIRDWAVVRGTYLGLPLDQGEDEADVPQLRVVAVLVD
jgi:streptomycin 6-kinase